MLADIQASHKYDAAFHATAAGATALESNVHPLLLSRQFWPEMEARAFTLPPRLAGALDAFATHYARAERKRRVRWLPQLGTVDVEVELADGRRIPASVAPLEAAVAELVASMGVAAAGEAAETTPPIVTADHVASALGIERATALTTLRFWVGHQVLQELAPPATGSFAVLERTPV